MAPRIDNKDNFIMRLLKAGRLLLREIVCFYSFFRFIPKQEKKIVFYAENQGYYSYFEGIIEKLISENDIKLCYITSDPNDSILKRKDSRLTALYSDKLLPFLMAFINCKVFVMTLLDLNQFHLKRSVNPVHYVYVFHSLFSTHMVYRYGSFDYYDSILCCGPHQVKEIRKHEELNKLSAKELIPAGYYRVERVYDRYHKYIQERTFSNKKGVILIAPSWGAANILELCGKDIVALLLTAGYEVIVRPHPELTKRSPGLIDSFTRRFGDNANFILETYVGTDDSLLRADVLISDYSGIVLEYAFGTERPVLFLDVPTKIKNPRYKELGIEPLEVSIRREIGAVVAPDNPEAVLKEVSRLMAEKENYQRRIIELRKQYVYAFGNSSQVGARHIMNLAKDSN